MQRLSMIKASEIIGGCHRRVCTSTYEAVVTGGVSSCKQVTTCTDKHGNSATVVMKDAPDGMCVVPNRIPQ